MRDSIYVDYVKVKEIDRLSFACIILVDIDGYNINGFED